MQRRSLWVVCFLLLALAFPGGAALADEGFSDFKDTSNHWASEATVQCRAMDLMYGYQGNLFKPKDALSKAEAVAIVIRAMGLEAQAGSTSTAGVTFPSGVWKGFQGHIVLAADKGMISKANIPSIAWNSPATRLEVALWLAVGLKLGTDSATLPFKDLSSVPAAYRGMLGAVVQKGIMTGTTSTTFEPNKTLTRAEMASILSKMLGAGYVTSSPGRFVVGKLTLLDYTAKKVTLEVSGSTKTYDLAATYLAYKGGKKVAIGVLPVGQNVKVVLDKNGKCLFIAYYSGTATVSPATGSGSHGRVTMIATGSYPFMSFDPDTGASISLPVDTNVKVTVRGATSSLAAVTVGATGTITVSGGKITAIDLDSGSTLSGDLDGYVVNKFWDCFSIRYDDGTSEEIDIDGLTFTKGGAVSSYGAVTRGTPVQLVKTGSRVTGVVILTSARKVFGEVTRCTSSAITIEDCDDYETAYDLASGVDIEDHDGDSLDWDEIEEGDEVAITLDSDGEATLVEVLEGVGDKIEGTVTKFDEDDDEITIEDEDGDEDTYDLDDDVTVKEDSSTRDLDDIDEGDEVRLTLNDDDDVTKIEILDGDEDKVEGTVVEVDEDREEITIEDDDNDEETYDLDDDVTVKEDSSTRDLDDIDEGDEVRLTLNDDGDVTKIEILDEDEDEDEIEGSVTDLDIDDEEIEIEDEDGDEKTYTFDADDVDMDDVLIGAEVTVTVNEDDEVVDIDITNDEDLDNLTGVLTYVNTSSEYVKIEQDSGNEFSFYFVSSPYLYDDDDDRIDIDDLVDYEDEDVEFDLDDGKIKKLWVQ